ncbi:hypothetical protein P7C70_g4503, partial [Phenoliferia sp. Uapishka_3]
MLPYPAPGSLIITVRRDGLSYPIVLPRNHEIHHLLSAAHHAIVNDNFALEVYAKVAKVGDLVKPEFIQYLRNWFSFHHPRIAIEDLDSHSSGFLWGFVDRQGNRNTPTMRISARLVHLFNESRHKTSPLHHLHLLYYALVIWVYIHEVGQVVRFAFGNSSTPVSMAPNGGKASDRTGNVIDNGGSGDLIETEFLGGDLFLHFDQQAAIGDLSLIKGASLRIPLNTGVGAYKVVGVPLSTSSHAPLSSDLPDSLENQRQRVALGFRQLALGPGNTQAANGAAGRENLSALLPRLQLPW